ncbi:MAG: Acetoin utilization protein AcuC [Fimbriimonadaceae bacterium]|nr:Acetoin utilization protein AcuC [Fimbriimonadaceae bacterium]
MALLFYHPRMLSYDFGPQHPLKPERLRRTIALFQAVQPGTVWSDPSPGADDDVLLVHDQSYLEEVRRLSSGNSPSEGLGGGSGFGSVDNPIFPGMHEASLAYLAGSIAAAQAVVDGESVAINISGGLHHARRNRASGFCIYNDAAAAIAVLKRRFDRVAYIDIDLHHGDGVEAIWWEDPAVFTYSIHQDGRTLYPGTGFVSDTGQDYSAMNVPLWPGTTGDVWLEAMERTLVPAMARFRPNAVVLQMGVDPHELDPLGHLRLTAQEWLAAIPLVQDLEVPIVALGGGGYNLTTVPRMWTAAMLTLLREPVPQQIPDGVDPSWGMTTFFDSTLPQPRQNQSEVADNVCRAIEGQVLPNVSAPK